MRPIEFRAWDGKKMIQNVIPWKDGYILDVSEYEHNTYGVEAIMQFTGLLDKNGTKIFEGDVVRILYSDWPSQSPDKDGKYKLSTEDYMKSIAHLGRIKFENCRFGITHFSEKYGDYGFDSIFPGQHGFIEVIGNIYSNPDLLPTQPKK